MSIPRRFAIAEASHRILNPLTSEKLATLGRALVPPGGGTVLDLACGKGELLCTWARDHGTTGVGVDLCPPFVTSARERAAELGVAQSVEFVEGDAAHWVSEDLVDIASCCGATWIGGGVEGTLDLLARSLIPGGLALIGEPFWREVPASEEALRACHAQSVDDFSTLSGLLGRMHHHGWDVVEMVLADEDSWDRYVAAQWLNLRRFIDANPDDDLVAELRAELDEAPMAYAEHHRRHLGWGVFALIAR